MFEIIVCTVGRECFLSFAQNNDGTRLNCIVNNFIILFRLDKDIRYRSFEGDSLIHSNNPNLVCADFVNVDLSSWH